MENNNKTFLALIMLNEQGQCISYEKNEFENYGEWSKADFDEFFEFSMSNAAFRADWEKNWNSLIYRNQADLRIVLDTMIAAGIMTNNGLNATDFIKPYVDTIMADHFNRRDAMSKLNARLGQFWDSIWDIPKRLFWGNLIKIVPWIMKKARG
jgi:hypothetical protein